MISYFFIFKSYFICSYSNLKSSIFNKPKLSSIIIKSWLVWLKILFALVANSKELFEYFLFYNPESMQIIKHFW